MNIIFKVIVLVFTVILDVIWLNLVFPFPNIELISILLPIGFLLVLLTAQVALNEKLNVFHSEKKKQKEST